MLLQVDLTPAPYPGSAPALADLLKGQVGGMFDPSPSSIAHVRSGELRALAVTPPMRSAALGDLVQGCGAGLWLGLGAPKGPSGPIVGKLNSAVNAGLADPSIKVRITGLGGTVISGSPESFATFIATETERYGRAIRAADIRAK